MLIFFIFPSEILVISMLGVFLIYFNKAPQQYFIFYDV